MHLGALMGINLLNDDSDKIKNDFFDEHDLESYESTTDLENPLTENPVYAEPDIHPDLVEPIDESYDPGKESKIKKYLIPVAAILLLITIFYFTLPYIVGFFNSLTSKDEVDNAVINEIPKVEIKKISENIISEASLRNAQLNFINTIFSKKNKDLTISHVYFSGSELIFESFSKNRDAFANLNIEMKEITENERFAVIKSNNRISPEGGIINVFSFKALKNKTLEFSELQTINDVKNIIQNNIQKNKLKTIELTEEKISGKQTLFIRVQGKKSEVLNSLISINTELKNVSLQKFSLSSKDLKSLSDNDLFLTIRFNILE
jgi:hypothetical protein